MKTHRGAAKRFKVTSTGKIMRAKSGKSHLLGKKSPKRKRQLKNEQEVKKPFQKKVKRMLGI